MQRSFPPSESQMERPLKGKESLMQRWETSAPVGSSSSPPTGRTPRSMSSPRTPNDSLSDSDGTAADLSIHATTAYGDSTARSL